MNTLLKSTAAFGLALSFAAFGATDAFAKAHDQGAANNDRTEVESPGESVESTVEGAFGLGSARGSRPEGKGPDKEFEDLGSGPRPSNVPDSPSGDRRDD